jgi:hypothetical protein
MAPFVSVGTRAYRTSDMRRMLDNHRHIGKHTAGVRRMPKGGATALREQPEDRRPTKRVFQGLAAVDGPGSRDLLAGVPAEQPERFPGEPHRVRRSIPLRQSNVCPSRGSVSSGRERPPPAIPFRPREGRLRGGSVATLRNAKVTAESPHALPSRAGSARRENPHASISCGYGLASPFRRCC